MPCLYSFYFEKAKNLNYIKSNHSQTQDYYADPNQFIGFSVDQMKEKFGDKKDLLAGYEENNIFP